MAIKYKGCDWDFNKGLLYVSFTNGKYDFKWYPKWTELDELMTASLDTEFDNKGKLTPYFGLICISLLVELIFKNKEFQHNDALYLALSKVKQALLESKKGIPLNNPLIEMNRKE